jgi:hypothetical protein
MIENFYTNSAQTSEHLLRDPIHNANLAARTVTWALKLASGGESIASGEAEYGGTVTIRGVTYYKFLVTISKAQAALMTAGVEYALHLDEEISGANAQPKAVAIIYRGE